MKKSLLLSPFFVLILMVTVESPGQCQNVIAVNDTIDLTPGYPKTVNILANDTFPAGDSIRINGGTTAGGGNVIATWHYGGYFTYIAPNRGVGNLAIGSYKLIDETTSEYSSAELIFRIRDRSFALLDVNDVSAKFNVHGNHFCSPGDLDPTHGPGFIVPKQTGKSPLFSTAVWIGGMDENDFLHVAAERYRAGGTLEYGKFPDFYAGPVMDSVNYSVDMDTTWSYIWKLTKADIEYHKQHWTDQGYVPIHDILAWPGNGDISLGQAQQLAPFFDMNNDGIYNPDDGDYPSIRGDQALFFIFNDDRGPHLETSGRKLKVEFHGMAYAFDIPDDSAFSKSVFLNYKIYNRSATTYHDTYLSVFTDLDIGLYSDDLLISDVGRGSYIGYNGKKSDGNGQNITYGNHPPAQSVTLLAGPLMLPTGEDRPRFDNSGHPLCDESVNGYGFGDGIANNERLGLNTTVTLFNTGYQIPSFMIDPDFYYQYFNIMNAVWKDSTHLTYGGKGHPDYGGYGPECHFIFPGESDTLNWGCGCQAPNGPVNWTETTANIPPNDIRGVGSVGSFNFLPGEMKELDIAFVWARDYTSPDTLASLSKLRTLIDVVRNAFFTNKLPGGGSFLGMYEPQSLAVEDISVYPIPASSTVTIGFRINRNESSEIQIISSLGRVIKSFTLPQGRESFLVDVSGYTSGLYLVTIRSGETVITKKLPVFR